MLAYSLGLDRAGAGNAYDVRGTYHGAPLQAALQATSPLLDLAGKIAASRRLFSQRPVTAAPLQFDTYAPTAPQQLTHVALQRLDASTGLHEALRSEGGQQARVVLDPRGMLQRLDSRNLQLERVWQDTSAR